MIIDVVRITGDGNIRRAIADTTGRADAARWQQFAEQASLVAPAQYRPSPGEPVYDISAGEHATQAGERNLAGLLRELVMAVLAEGVES